MSRKSTGDSPIRRVGRLAMLALGLVLLIFCSTAAFNFGQEIFSKYGVEAAPGTDKVIMVEEGTTMDELGELLQELGIIRDSKIFYVQAKFFEVKSVKPGNYTFNTSQTGEEILRVIEAGPEEEQEETKQ